VSEPDGPATADVALACAADARYAMPLAAMLHSVVAHLDPARRLTVHVLAEGIGDGDRDRVVRSCARDGVSMDWIAADPDALRDLPTWGRMPRTTYQRLLLPDLLPHLSKVVWLDCDVVVETDLGRLWDVGMDRWRRDEVAARVLEYLRAHHDQVLLWDRHAHGHGLHLDLTKPFGHRGHGQQIGRRQRGGKLALVTPAREEDLIAERGRPGRLGRVLALPFALGATHKHQRQGSAQRRPGPRVRLHQDIVHDHAARLRSYELLAGAFAPSGPGVRLNPATRLSSRRSPIRPCPSRRPRRFNDLRMSIAGPSSPPCADSR
jgi:Glycosyl transferase family 8